MYSEKSKVGLGNWHNEGCLITQVSLKETNKILCRINTNIMKTELKNFAASEYPRCSVQQ